MTQYSTQKHPSQHAEIDHFNHSSLHQLKTNLKEPEDDSRIEQKQSTGSKNKTANYGKIIKMGGETIGGASPIPYDDSFGTSFSLGTKGNQNSKAELMS